MVAITPIGWGFLGLAAISAGFLVFSLVRLARAHAPLTDDGLAPVPESGPVVEESASAPASVPEAEPEPRDEPVTDERSDEER